MHIPQTSAARRRSYLLSNSPNKRSPWPPSDKRYCLSQLALGHPNLAWPLPFSINTRCQQVFRANHLLTSALLANFFSIVKPFFKILFPKQRRHNHESLAASSLKMYIPNPGHAQVSRLPRLAYTCLDLPRPA